MMNLEAMKPGNLQHAELTDRIIAAAIRVHTELGPGFLESTYEEAVAIELTHDRIQFTRQKPVGIFYRGQRIGEHRLDFMVEECVIVELKATSALEAVHFATVRSYLKACDLEVGLLLNFAAPTVAVKRVGREQFARPRNFELA